MMGERLPTELWVSALVRRAQIGGAAGFILQRGDGARGDVLVKVARLDGTARAYVPGFDMESGVRIFSDLALRGIGESEAEIDAYIARARDRDSDLWVIEIEDREGRHFLVEPVELAGETE
ncbi:MAG: DUF1491 family protein [Hyphomonadaceae bacterium]|nr:DUF1491 family protein [Hyphomonadaceae bacterium]